MLTSAGCNTLQSQSILHYRDSRFYTIEPVDFTLQSQSILHYRASRFYTIEPVDFTLQSQSILRNRASRFYAIEPVDFTLQSQSILHCRASRFYTIEPVDFTLQSQSIFIKFTQIKQRNMGGSCIIGNSNTNFFKYLLIIVICPELKFLRGKVPPDKKYQFCLVISHYKYKTIENFAQNSCYVLFQVMKCTKKVNKKKSFKIWSITFFSCFDAYHDLFQATTN